MEENGGIKRSHIFTFLIVHGLTILTLVFWVGVTFNRIAVIDQRSSDTAHEVAEIQQNGTAAIRVQLDDIKAQINRLETRLEAKLDNLKGQ